MATSSPLEDTHLLTSPFSLPNPDIPIPQILSRWSDTRLDAHPAIIITPKTEQDVVSAVRFARRNKLLIVAAGGSHGLVPIDASTLYLDMKNFKSIHLDKDSGVVRFGGGVLTGEVLRCLAQEGYYTTLANSNAVGVVGSILGGGSTSQAGLQGWVADNVLSFRLVSASGDIVEVGSSSQDKEELALFHALCGAGHGLGVITAATMKAYSTLKGLNLLQGEPGEPKVWSRMMMFPPTAIDAVAQTFLAHTPPPKPMNLVVLFLRSPPGTASAGKPLIVLAASYFGPASDAEATSAAASLLDPSIVKQAIQANTALQPLTQTNNAMEVNNIHGGYKTSCGVRLRSLSPESIKAAFEKWLAITEKHPDAARTMNMLHSFNPSQLTKLGAHPEHKDRFLDARDRGFTAVAGTWCYETSTRDALVEYANEALATFRQADSAAGVVPRTFPNVMRPDADLNELFADDKLADLARIKERWDADGLFWYPYRR